jgi:hypothetical protein
LHRPTRALQRVGSLHGELFGKTGLACVGDERRTRVFGRDIGERRTGGTAAAMPVEHAPAEANVSR